MDDINKPTTLTEISSVLGKSKRSVEILANKNKWIFTVCPKSGKKRLYNIDNLPKDIREKINISRLNANLRLLDGSVAQPLPESPLVPAKSEVLDDKQRERDGARRLILQFLQGFKGSDKKAVGFLNAGYAENSLNPDLMHAIKHCNDKLNDNRTGKLSLRSVTRWKTDAKNNGNCIPKKTRIETPWDGVWWMPVILCCYRKPQKPRVTEAYAAFEQELIQQGVTDIPCYGSVNRMLKRVPKVISEAGRSTGSELAALKPFIRRDWSNMSSNEVWVGDGHTFKAKVRHPIHGYAFAPEVTVIIDAASRYIVGWAFSLSENQLAVSEALGKGMLKHGKPLIYYSDNGSGQTAKTIDCPAGGMLARLGVTHETGIPGNPQGRGLIEGLWDITTILVAKHFPTFQGTGMDKDTLRKNTQAIDSAKRKGEVPNIVPTWQQFIEACEARFNWYNTEHKHSSLGGKTPEKVYHANFDESWACRLTADEIINLYRPSIERTPVRGEIKWLNNIYFNAALVELPANTKVRMSYDCTDARKVWVSDLNGRFICEAEFEGNKRAGFPVSLTDALKEKRIDGITKRGQETIDRANAERGNIFEGEVLQRVPVIPSKLAEPLKPFVVDLNFNKKEPENALMGYLETMISLKQG